MRFPTKEARRPALSALLLFFFPSPLGVRPITANTSVDFSFVDSPSVDFPSWSGFQMTPHHFTLLDGEMVVDEDITTGVRTRRFLIYDLMMSQSQSYIQRSFGERFKAIHDEVLCHSCHLCPLPPFPSECPAGLDEGGATDACGFAAHPSSQH